MTTDTRANDPSLALLRERIRENLRVDEVATIGERIRDLGWEPGTRTAVSQRAAALVRGLRADSSAELMESFLAEYGLSTREGVALMCLAEALLRVPDSDTIDALIADKIAPSDWGRHLGRATSSLVNASTWALMLTGRMLGEEDEGVVGALHGMLRRLGEPVVRSAVSQAMRELGHQFVLGRDIEEACERGQAMTERGYTYSFDMLGEAARTDADARRYHLSYSDAIASLAPLCVSPEIRDNPGISVKLSALHERYEFAQRERVLSELVARTRSLAMLAHSANMGFNIDAEEADRLELSLEVIEAVLSEPSLAGWDGFGVVVQAYGPRAPYVLEWLYALAGKLQRRLMVRLVKGAYWDSEVKHAQEQGLDGFPVFTRKVCTDVSYLHCAQLLLGMRDRIYPQFATHNAHTVAGVLHMAGGAAGYEFQRLHGMGEALHEAVRQEAGTRCRVYAPVGAHQDLLAYLVRRLLENGANSSFVHQIMDARIAPEVIAADPLTAAEIYGPDLPHPAVVPPLALFTPGRVAARGVDLTDPVAVADLDAQREAFRHHSWMAAPMLSGAPRTAGAARPVHSPSDREERVGEVEDSNDKDIEHALDAARNANRDWANAPVSERAACLNRIADAYEANGPELFALLAREAGKTQPDAVAELREAVDFCRYYANQAQHAESLRPHGPRGVVVCISPWNFPLAIFTGQIVAALVTGNCVIAKPAEQTPLVAARAVALMRESGVPDGVIQLLPGDGPSVGASLVGDPRVDGVCFTGSTQTAHAIHRAMAGALSPDAPLIAETGGLNAMVVDSTALPEQAVRDIVISAFQSAGQRCSALRVLYVQEEVEERLLRMLEGAMDALVVGQPWELSTDVGPVIDEEARAAIETHCEAMDAAGRRIKRMELSPRHPSGRFVAPSIYRLDRISQLEREVFGPILHVVRYRSGELDRVVDEINATGYGLTFALHTRVDSRVQAITERIHCGNVYVNRNQIGAVVGVQPFGGEGLSGTGPKAGGPLYLLRFRRAAGALEPGVAAQDTPAVDASTLGRAMSALQSASWRLAIDRPARLVALLDRVDELLGRSTTRPARDALLRLATRAEARGAPQQELPGPTGESNRLFLRGRGVVLCLGDGDLAEAMTQATQCLVMGCPVVLGVQGFTAVADVARGLGIPLVALPGRPDDDALSGCQELAGVMASGDQQSLSRLRQLLASRDGPILPLICTLEEPERLLAERVLSVDTTAAGGNATLLAEAADDPLPG